MVIINYLRQNAREKLATISRKTGIPVTTIHDQLKADTFVKKYTALLDFEKLGFNAKFLLAVAVSPADKDKLRDFFLKHYRVNSLYAINNGFDFLAEGIFEQIKEAEEFIGEVEQNFDIRGKQVHYVVKELKHEHFLSNQHLPC
jgi:DNA-binding Lrp family transcriptional regulator